MTHQNPPEHFKGKSVAQHLKDARKRGSAASVEAHGTELPGHHAAFYDCAKETAVIFLIIWALCIAFSLDHHLLFHIIITLGFGLILWKSGRSALLGWARLERLHRVIEEERWEIEHHRDQEKEELRAMYEIKGFSGKLLDEVVDVLMADDNRLLRVMLEEELGLSLEAYEHPLKQAFSAALAAILLTLLSGAAFYFWPYFGVPLISLLTVVFVTNKAARQEKRSQLASIIWNFALALFASGAVYFLAQLTKP